ncbi:MAG: SH3 domain-containing protein [Leptospiraceae bacterium]|nr:SH3 domain-containing protein [Leptospiraceae bacterium]MBP9889697.1 SH3 domain-containing protein [Leptospiraceae bacterium]
MKFLIILFCIFMTNCVNENIRNLERIGLPELSIPQIRILYGNFENNSLKQSKVDFNPLTKALPSMILSDFATTKQFELTNNEDRLKVLKEISAKQKAGLNNETNFAELYNVDWLLSGDFIEFENNISINARIINFNNSKTLFAINKTFPTNELLLTSSSRKGKIKEVSQSLLEQIAYVHKNIGLEIETTKIAALLNNYEGELLIDDITINKEVVINKDKNYEKKINDIKKKANEKFAKALEIDPDYKKPKENIQKVNDCTYFAPKRNNTFAQVNEPKGLFLRVGPSQSYDKILLLPDRSKLKIIEPANNVDKIYDLCSPWYKVIYIDPTEGEKTGWVFGGLLKFEN